MCLETTNHNLAKFVTLGTAHLYVFVPFFPLMSLEHSVNGSSQFTQLLSDVLVYVEESMQSAKLTSDALQNMQSVG